MNFSLRYLAYLSELDWRVSLNLSKRWINKRLVYVSVAVSRTRGNVREMRKSNKSFSDSLSKMLKLFQEIIPFVEATRDITFSCVTRLKLKFLGPEIIFNLEL